MKKTNKFKKKYKEKGNVLLKTIPYIFVVIVLMLSIGWAAFSQQLEIDGMSSTVRIQADIRITGISVSNDNDFNNYDAVSNWEDYNVKHIQTSVSLPNDNSQIKYKVQVTNFGNAEMGILNITGLPDYLEYKIENYNLKDKICDENGCKLGTQKDIYVIIRYKDGIKSSDNINHIIDLDFDFKAYFKIKYTNFPGKTDTLPNEVIESEKIIIDLSNYEKGVIKVKEDGVVLSKEKYKYENNILEITSVTGNIEIIYRKLSEIEFFLRNNDNNNYITDELFGDMYRYQGTDDVNNWICFGTTDKNECTTGGDSVGDGFDKYMYRIIGVTPEGELALIKETFVKENNTAAFQWNNKATIELCGEDGSKCTWNQATLLNRLNGLCNEDNQHGCTGVKHGSEGDSNIFIGNEYYNYLQTEQWLNKITTHTWKYGYVEHENGHYNGDSIYEIENKFTTSVQAKIGLQYMHDYYYAYEGGIPNNYNNAKTAWIFFQKYEQNKATFYEWLITRYGVDGPRIRTKYVHSTGSTDYSNPSSYGNGGVRPVFYLASYIILKEGTTGERNNPYILDLEYE